MEQIINSLARKGMTFNKKDNRYEIFNLGQLGIKSWGKIDAMRKNGISVIVK